MGAKIRWAAYNLRNPEMLLAFLALDPTAFQYAELGQRDQAVAAADRGVRSTANPAILSQIAAAYVLAGKADKARAKLPNIEGRARERYVCGFNVACIYSVLGDKEQALAWLEKAYRDRSD